ncbi:hypothetical protein BC793_107371 [Actinoplanes xinjiangensis]|uniref:Uncharacterized protein n=1 Tax=Actinoplanes xinjiangensis TaxID=512350 RepID=A0A316FFP8_9ACTN|nr:hypothetical protein BC793_107371 [Actinoplanes xinjiangensis]GIF39305.1 hypothetical protein Axi01nite_36160 [Actinoplanes xinjiangensis]
MVPITEPLEPVDPPPAGKPDRDGVVIPIRRRGSDAEFRPPRRNEPPEHAG